MSKFPHHDVAVALVNSHALHHSTFKHIKTGGYYTIVGACLIESTLDVGVLYQSITDADPVSWCRPFEEFFDGRFEEVQHGT